MDKYLDVVRTHVVKNLRLAAVNCVMTNCESMNVSGSGQGDGFEIL